MEMGPKLEQNGAQLERNSRALKMGLQIDSNNKRT